MGCHKGQASRDYVFPRARIKSAAVRQLENALHQALAPSPTRGHGPMLDHEVIGMLAASGNDTPAAATEAGSAARRSPVSSPAMAAVGSGSTDGSPTTRDTTPPECAPGAPWRCAAEPGSPAHKPAPARPAPRQALHRCR
ncbi:hypothetical protein G6F32_014636 [Rhizopus arrhizus]|nr:hypothetical protein G6F32_014636 [Rhizopus arrhizus]